MIIIHPINKFLFELFNSPNGDLDDLKNNLLAFYSTGSVIPKIEQEDEIIKVIIDTDKFLVEKNKFQKLISLCEASKLTEAKNLAEELIKQSPTVSEYHRIHGQVCSDLGDQEEAINSLIYALRWDPKNEWALLMMGNIFAKYKNDVDTAMKYYDQVLQVKPDDNIALNNIGANLMQLGKNDEAANYFEKAIQADPNYPNTYYAFGLLASSEGNFDKAFENALTGLEKSKKKDQLHGLLVKLAITAANALVVENKPQTIVEELAKELSEAVGKRVTIKEDDSIPTAAKIELAENYDRDYHLIKYKSNYPSVEHLVMHELMHLQLAHEAREAEKNLLFTTNQSHKTKFFYYLEKEAKKLIKKGFSEESLSNYLAALFEGINRQLFNGPIDLFIEDRIYNNFQGLRPSQFLSLVALVKEGVEANIKKEIVTLTPPAILSISKIFNLVNAIHLKKLYKIDLVQDHNPTKSELNQAEEFYREFDGYRYDKEPGEEYELVQHWGEDLKLDGYFELVPELEYKRKTIESVISEIENDPFGTEATNPSQERKMKQFIDSHAEKDLNMAVAMYMLGALQMFDKLPKAKISEIAFQIAMIGTAGIDPHGKNYRVPLIEGEVFSGYRLLSYYYVSWALAHPEALPELKLPFDKEYELAKMMRKQ